MALLYRATRLKDRADTHVFTFVVTRSATREPDRDVTSKDFCCAHQRWAVAFSRTDASLGVYLVWRGACEGMRVYVDFTFTLLSRDHFTANEGFSGKQVRFSAGCAAQGRGRCVSLAELNAKFADARGEFQLELSMSRVRTLYSCELRAPRLDTPPIAFAGFDWSVSATGGSKEPLSLRLMRLSGEGQRCRVRYALALGEGERRLHSGPLECVCDAEGRTPPWNPRPPSRLLHKGVRLTVELVWARALTELAIPAAGRAATCYDRDKQAWSVRCDMHSETVRMHMLYRDVHHVPRNHLRYVSWSAWLVRSAPAPGEPDAEELPGAPFEHYYAQESADEGLMMETALRVEDVSRPGCPFLHPGGELRVRLEWGDTYLLFQATYHVYDDLCRLQGHQMRREIAALQAENYSLERQLFSYQKSLAYAQAQAGEPTAAESGGRRSPAERSLSTDTEYA
ncbi:uncharacterized protein LOC113518372 [Galleria mellonella]|uniref:Uncharacterized protein LOC113518372 n=1 Tax=Galleria mellonella TaxID=7137 RepID=A0A6J1WTZ4_GALME|nr:uncharacterized protein LOC113518372 [Galleria mellonella]XP_052757771.1 uncharacterized protein LOC113518372 [Galleria mellonella]